MNILQLQRVFLWNSSVYRALHFRRVQNTLNFTEDGSHRSKVVRITHQGYKRCDDTDRENNDCYQILRRKRSTFYQKTADGEHGNHCGGHDYRGECKGENTGAHPIDIAVSGFIRIMHKAVVGTFCISENLDDLNAADIFNRRIIECLCGCNRALIKLRTALHHKTVTEKSHRYRCKRCQPHTPVNGKNVDQNDDGDQ